MSNNSSDVELCLEYLEKQLEDDDKIEIFLHQEEADDSLDGGNDELVQEFKNTDDSDDDELEDVNLFMDSAAIPTSKSTTASGIPTSAFGKTSTAKKLNTKVDKLTTDDEQNIASEICEFSQTDNNFVVPEYANKINDNDDSDYVMKEVKIIDPSPTKPVALGPYQCMKCLYNTNRKKLLMMHLRKHADKIYKCSVCEKSFKRKDNLKKHLESHTDAKTFECADCDQSFPSSWKLKFHRNLSHIGIKPLQCEICDYMVFESHAMKRHMRIHTNERLHKCTLCPHASYTSTALKIHLRSHTNEKPFVCYICDASYKKMVSLKRHTDIHHKDSQTDDSGDIKKT